MRPIRVLVVEDSLVFRELLVQNLNKDPAIEVVAVAKDPFEARDAILKYRPDVMTLDVELPRMNGIEFLRKLMPQYPIPVVVISALSDKVFEALNAGAVDFVAKPVSTGRAQIEDFIHNELSEKVKIASNVKTSNIKKTAMLQTAQQPTQFRRAGGLPHIRAQETPASRRRPRAHASARTRGLPPQPPLLPSPRGRKSRCGFRLCGKRHHTLPRC